MLTLVVADYIIHEGFSLKKTADGAIVQQHDIVLLELEDHVYLDVYTPACLPRPRNTRQLSGERATVAGWGHTSYNGTHSSVLLEVELPIVSNTLCRQKMGFRLYKGQICAGGEEGRDSCQVELQSPIERFGGVRV